MKIGFFRALYGSCCGTAIFSRLSEQHPLRAFWHLILMSLLSSIIITIGVYPGLQQKVRGSVALAVRNCGSLQCSAQMIKPEKDPDKARTFLVTGPLAICYMPATADKLPDDFQKDCSQGVLWNGTQIALWNKLPGGSYSLLALGDPLAGVMPQEVAGKGELFTEFKKTPSVKLNVPPGETVVIGEDKMNAWAELLLRLSWGAWMIRQTFFEVLIYIAMFMGVFLLMSIGRPRRLTFRKMLVLAVYAGFPAMLAGSVADAAQLPFFNFNMIYVFGMTLYLIVIMNRLERERQQRAGEI